MFFRTYAASEVVPRAVVAFALTAVACTATINATIPISGRGPVPSNSGEIAACKGACSKQHSQSCLAEDALDGCNGSCERSTSDEAAHYQSCVEKDACDTTCSASLPAKDSDAGASGSLSVPKQDGGKVDAATSTRDAGKDTGAPIDTSLDDCKYRCTMTTPTFVNCFPTPMGQYISMCQDGCLEGSKDKRAQFIACVGALTSAPAECPQYLSCVDMLEH